MTWPAIVLLPVAATRLAMGAEGAVRRIFWLIAMVLPVAFAALRDPTVGTDVMTYAVWMDIDARSQSLLSFLNRYNGISEPGFSVLAWVGSRMFGLAGLLGLAQLFVVVPFVRSIRSLCGGASWMAMALYMLFVFPMSLNAMRQAIAVAMCVPLICTIGRGSVIRRISRVLIVAILFHRSAVVVAAMIPFLWAVRRIHERNQGLGRAAAVLGMYSLTVIVGLFVLWNSRSIVASFAVLKDSYQFQAVSVGTGHNTTAVVFGVALVLFTGLLRSDGARDLSVLPGNRDNIYLLTVTALGFMLFELNVIADGLLRVGYYFAACLPVTGGSLAARHDSRSRFIALAVLCLCIGYFFVVDVVNGGDGVYPYSSSILGV